MTSSLVGSEMCIRDRRNHRCGSSSSCRGNLGASRTSHRIPVLLQITFRAVSYTHLTLPTICSV
eukprot:4669334-Prorocentrum_lima.AAC.1